MHTQANNQTFKLPHTKWKGRLINQKLVTPVVCVGMKQLVTSRLGEHYITTHRITTGCMEQRLSAIPAGYSSGELSRLRKHCIVKWLGRTSGVLISLQGISADRPYMSLI